MPIFDGVQKLSRILVCQCRWAYSQLYTQDPIHTGEMEKFAISRRYVKRKELFALLKRLFNQDYSVTVRQLGLGMIPILTNVGGNQ